MLLAGWPVGGGRPFALAALALAVILAARVLPLARLTILGLRVNALLLVVPLFAFTAPDAI